MNRVYNFAAGPSMLPAAALEKEKEIERLRYREIELLEKIHSLLEKK